MARPGRVVQNQDKTSTPSRSRHTARVAGSSPAVAGRRSCCGEGNPTRRYTDRHQGGRWTACATPRTAVANPSTLVPSTVDRGEEVTRTVGSDPGRAAELRPRGADLRCEGMAEPVVTRRRSRLTTVRRILRARLVVRGTHNAVRAVVSLRVQVRRLAAWPGKQFDVEDGRLLVLAAGRLPEITGTGPVLSSDVHASLFAAAAWLGFGCAARAHRAADHAEAVLVRDLLARGELTPDDLVSRRLHSWLMHQSVATVAQALHAAADRQERGKDGAGAVVQRLRDRPGRYRSRRRRSGPRCVETAR